MKKEKKAKNPVIPMDRQKIKIKYVADYICSKPTPLDFYFFSDIIREYRDNPKLLYKENVEYLGWLIIKNHPIFHPTQEDDNLQEKK